MTDYPSVNSEEFSAELTSLLRRYGITEPVHINIEWSGGYPILVVSVCVVQGLRCSAPQSHPAREDQ